jgi:hypothetical protein
VTPRSRTSGTLSPANIDAVVPYPALFGAHAVLTTYYGHSNADASRLLQKFMDAKRVRWYDGTSGDVVRDGLSGE